MDSKTGEIISLTPGTSSLKGTWFEIVEEDRAGIPDHKTFIFGKESIFTGGHATTSFSNKDGISRALVTWRRPSGIVIQGEVMLRPDDKGPLFRLKVTNTTGTNLVDKIRLPMLRGIKLGNGDDDWFTYPHTLGAAFRVNGLKQGQKLEDPYPALMFMQWLDCYDNREGVFIGSLDDYGYNKSLMVGRSDDGRSFMGFNFGGCWIAKKGDSWTTPWVQIASHKGDWRAGADIYRGFAEKAFAVQNAPEYIREMPTAQVWLSYHATNKDAGKLFEIQQQSPIHASYVMKSLNTSFPEGWDGFQGSALEYHDAFDRIRELGGAPALFTFDRAPLMGRPNYADYAAKWTRQRRDGSFDEGFKDMIAAPLDKDFIRARVQEAVRWVREFNIDEIHYDTEATCGDTGEVGVGMFAGPAYNSGLPIRPNEVPHYFKELYNKTLVECRKYNPNFSLRGEDCADFFFPSILTSTAHFFTTSAMLSAHKVPEDAKMMPMLLRYTLPRYASFLMPSVSSDDFWTYGYGMGYGFHGGGPSWCINPGVREAEQPAGELNARYGFYDAQWREYYDFRVGFEEAIIDAEKSENTTKALIDGKWTSCEFPGPVIAITHTGGGREVTLGQWFHRSETVDFGQRFVGANKLAPRPIRLRMPTKLANPTVRLFGSKGEIPCKPTISKGMIELDIADPVCFAVEVFTGPSITINTEPITQPGKITRIEISIQQPKPIGGTITLKLPTGWQTIKPIRIPAQREFKTAVDVQIPKGIFGRNYPIKAVMQIRTLKRTTACHLKVMEPLSVVYSFDTLDSSKPLGLYCIEPGKKARLTVTCVNNTASAGNLELNVSGQQVKGRISEKIGGVQPSELGEPNGALDKWFTGKHGVPGNAMVKTFDFDCVGITSQPVVIQASVNGKQLFKESVYPRVRLMDLNGEWKVRYLHTSNANVGGIFGREFMDFEATTPDVWDGNWETIKTPFTLDKSRWEENAWAIYRRMVFIPASWQGEDIQLRLTSMGGLRWGPEGALNIVYINGWPAGRIGVKGERPLNPFLVYGGWNLFCVISSSPQQLVDPYLFVRKSADPQMLKPSEDVTPPKGAFALLGSRITGQGVAPVFMTGIPEGDYRRTDLKANWIENQYIYFSVADQFIREPKSPVEVEIEYLDDGNGAIGMDYDSSDKTAFVEGAFKAAPEFNRTGTGEWKTHVWTLPDARFVNREHAGSDFRIYGKGTNLRIRRIEVRLTSISK
ncbi:MAG: hypothetical protein ACYC0V_16250 [Armatimonadota bacterium]